MCWQITAAIAASATFLLMLGILIYPWCQKRRWRKIISNVTDMRDMAVELQNENWTSLLSPENIARFNEEATTLHKLLMTEIAEISEEDIDTDVNIHEYGLDSFKLVRLH